MKFSHKPLYQPMTLCVEGLLSGIAHEPEHGSIIHYPLYHNSRGCISSFENMRCSLLLIAVVIVITKMGSRNSSPNGDQMIKFL